MKVIRVRFYGRSQAVAYPESRWEALRVWLRPGWRASRWDGRRVFLYP